MPVDDVSKYLATIGRKGGLARSKRKARVARRNGRKRHKNDCDCDLCKARRKAKAL